MVCRRPCWSDVESWARRPGGSGHRPHSDAPSAQSSVPLLGLYRASLIHKWGHISGRTPRCPTPMVPGPSPMPHSKSCKLCGAGISPTNRGARVHIHLRAGALILWRSGPWGRAHLRVPSPGTPCRGSWRMPRDRSMVRGTSKEPRMPSSRSSTLRQPDQEDATDLLHAWDRRQDTKLGGTVGRVAVGRQSGPVGLLGLYIHLLVNRPRPARCHRVAVTLGVTVSTPGPNSGSGPSAGERRSTSRPELPGAFLASQRNWFRRYTTAQPHHGRSTGHGSDDIPLPPDRSPGDIRLRSPKRPRRCGPDICRLQARVVRVPLPNRLHLTVRSAPSHLRGVPVRKSQLGHAHTWAGVPRHRHDGS